MNEQQPVTLTNGQRCDRLQEALEKLYFERAEIVLAVEAAQAKGEMHLMGKTMSDLSAISESIREVTADLGQVQHQMIEAFKCTERRVAHKIKAAQVPVVACYAPIGNYYGTPFVFETAEGHFFGIRAEGCGGECVKVSKAFFEAFTRDLGGDFCEIGVEQKVQERAGSPALTLYVQSPGRVEDYDSSYDDEGDDE